jgi:hypothetical protein
MNLQTHILKALSQLVRRPFRNFWFFYFISYTLIN